MPSAAFIATLFLLTGALHFVRPAYFLGIMPPYVPYPLAAVYVSGFFEILFGALFLFPQCRMAAA